LNKLREIKTLAELSTFVPEIIRMHDEFANKWDKESDAQEFLSELLKNFGPDAYFFGNLDENGKLEYLAIIYHLGENCQFRAFYVDKQKHELTRELIEEIRVVLRTRNYKHCFFTTVRITKSYDRWIRKLGAKPCEITYNISLT